MTRAEALRLRAIMEQATASLDDAVASTIPALFPRLKQDGSLIKSGARINWGGIIKRAAVDLWDTAENTPGARLHCGRTWPTGMDTASFRSPSRRARPSRWMR